MPIFLDWDFKMTDNKKRIYLAGSFYDFRDKIIKALPDFEFADPRNHKQHAIATFVVDDMREAEECPVILACFPKGEKRGMGTYAEIGAARVRGNYIIIIDENGQNDYQLSQIADANFKSTDDAIDFLKNNEYGRDSSKEIVKKSVGDGFRIFWATAPEYTKGLEKIVQNGKKIVTPKDLESIEDFGRMDMTVVHFPSGLDRDNHAALAMGMAYALQTWVCMLDEQPVLYPPLIGISKRVFTKKEPFLDYLSQIKSLDVDEEAQLIYRLIEKYPGDRFL